MPKHVYKNPVDYSKNNALQYNFAMKILRKIAFNAKSRVLDIGSGDGLITFEMAKIVSEGCVIGTDISTQMVEYANITYPAQCNLRFVQMDAAKNIFRNQFDIVTSFNCLHWVSDQQAALIGIAQAAAENATIVLLLSHRKSLYHFVLDSVCSNPRWSEYFLNYQNPRSFFNLEDYRRLAASSGLNVLELVEEEMTYHYPNKEQLREFFKASMANIKQIPLGKKDEFLNDFCDEFVRKVELNSKDEIPVSFWCLQVVATKPAVLRSEIDLQDEKKEHKNRLFSKL